MTQPTTQPTTHIPLPPPFNSHSSHPPTLLTQGAEALVYRTTFLHPSTPCALKFRPSKPYRHPVLDKRLTKQRILAEARVLVRCRKEGVRVPAVLGADWEAGWLVLEWIEGATIRKCLDVWSPSKIPTASSSTGEEGREEEEGEREDIQHRLKDLMHRIGRAIGKLHSIGVVHGDLTTSNIMLRPPSIPTSEQRTAIPETGTGDSSNDMDIDGTIVLIDFGLAVQTTQDEDKAVDLYVLERAFGATHPRAEEEGLFKEVLEAYAGSYKGGKEVLKRLEEVRLRGRKRSMLG
ncbi:MAG: serine/threonine-protein kinase bud32 [Bogoriella megaspora]|nr:MAG: serine/threonine-protein kinase bud32 [Bogoriella megaspora]